MYFVTSVLPQAPWESSLMQQIINFLKSGHIMDANSMLSEILGLNPIIHYPAVTGDKMLAKIVRFSDAAHGGKYFFYSQSVGVIGIRIPRVDVTKGAYYFIG